MTLVYPGSRNRLVYTVWDFDDRDQQSTGGDTGIQYSRNERNTGVSGLLSSLNQYHICLFPRACLALVISVRAKISRVTFVFRGTAAM